MHRLTGLFAAGLLVPATAALAAEPAPDQPTLPGYALGQPLAEARSVVPPWEARAGWALRCSGDAEAPPALVAAAAPTGRLICWPMRLTAAGAERAATLPRRLHATEELEFRHGRVVRITQAWRRADGTAAEITFSDRQNPGR